MFACLVCNIFTTCVVISVVDPDPHGSALIFVGWIRIGSWRAKMIHKKVKKLCFKVLDVLLCGLKASPVACTFFHEAWG
jgi:hypothetical protein